MIRTKAPWPNGYAEIWTYPVASPMIERLVPEIVRGQQGHHYIGKNVTISLSGFTCPIPELHVQYPNIFLRLLSYAQAMFEDSGKILVERKLGEVVSFGKPCIVSESHEISFSKKAIVDLFTATDDSLITALNNFSDRKLGIEIIKHRGLPVGKTLDAAHRLL